MGVAEVARLLARTLASPATHQIIMDRALGRWYAIVRLFLGMAALLLIATLAWLAFGPRMQSHRERQLATDFGHYLKTFQRSPSEAQQFFSGGEVGQFVPSEAVSS
jgi:hypothetical protein